MIKLVLPIPPTANHYQPHGLSRGKCIRYLSSAGKQFKHAVLCEVLKHHAMRKLSQRLAMVVVIHPRNHQAIDLDNRIKPLQDALEHANVFVNDSQIDFLAVRRGTLIKGGQCVVYIAAINHSTDDWNWLVSHLSQLDCQ